MVCVVAQSHFFFGWIKTTFLDILAPKEIIGGEEKREKGDNQREEENEEKGVEDDEEKMEG